MGILISLLFLLTPIAVIAAVVGIVVATRRADDEPADDPGIGTVRRVFLYGIAFVALMIAASGVAMLVGGALNAAADELVISSSDTQLAVALAFTVVGVPAWLIFALLAQRSVTREPVEHRSQARWFYFALVRGVAITVVAVNAIGAARFLAGIEDFDGDPWGWLLAWAGVWAVHTRLASGTPAPTAATRLLDRLYGYYAAVLGLYLFGGGTILALHAPLDAIYDQATRDTLVARSWDQDARNGIAVAAVGFVLWAWHWLRALRTRDAGATLWHAYVFLAGITPGLAGVVTSLAVLLFTALQWWFGDPRATEASAHFASVPGVVSVLVVAAISWGYHRAALREGDPSLDRWSTPERIYRYLVAAAGLLTLCAGLVMLLAVALDAVPPRTDELFRPRGWHSDSLVLGVTLLVVGAPLWLRYWAQAQREVVQEGASERVALPRRTYLFALFGLAALVTLVDLTIVLYQLFEGLLEGSLSSEFVRDTRWSVALVLVAGAAGIYHWLVMREDQSVVPAPRAAAPVRVKEVTLLAPAGSDDLLRALESIPGVRARHWQRPGDPIAIAPDRLEAIHTALAASDGDHYLLVATPDSLDLIPYQPR